MKELIPKDLSNVIPGLAKGDDTIAYAKLFLRGTNFQWFVTEYDGEDLCFGLVGGFVWEYNCFRLSQLQTIKAPFWFEYYSDKNKKIRDYGEVERDVHFGYPVSLEPFIARELAGN